LISLSTKKSIQNKNYHIRHDFTAYRLMQNNYQKRYIEVSNEFRKSKASKESVDKCYDLLYELEKADRTENDSLTLSNLYTLLEFHLSAYEIFKPLADMSNKKIVAKLYKMEKMATSHEDTFRIKDLRKLRKINKQTKLSTKDFKMSKREENQVDLVKKDLVIFNKIIKNDKIEIFIYGENKLEDYVEKLISYINWLSDCKKQLIDFYNKELSQYTEQTADSDWYHLLEFFSCRIIVGENGNLYAEITGGDNFQDDHLLDIEIENKEITEMRHDG